MTRAIFQVWICQNFHWISALLNYALIFTICIYLYGIFPLNCYLNNALGHKNKFNTVIPLKNLIFPKKSNKTWKWLTSEHITTRLKCIQMSFVILLAERVSERTGYKTAAKSWRDISVLLKGKSIAPASPIVPPCTKVYLNESFYSILYLLIETFITSKLPSSELFD